MANEIMVEVAYATPEHQEIVTVKVFEGATIAEVIAKSGIQKIFPEIDLTQQKVGIFSKIQEITQTVKSGDRIEIYRPLTLDPNASRLQRAKAAGQVLRKKGELRRLNKRADKRKTKD